jgi:hypothetical protein
MSHALRDLHAGALRGTRFAFMEVGSKQMLNTTGSWSMKIALSLAVAALVWAGAASIAVSALGGRLRGGPSTQPAPPPVVTAR